MPNSNVVFAFLLFAFLVFITARGELPTYMGFLLGASDTSKGGTSASATGKVGEVVGQVNSATSAFGSVLGAIPKIGNIIKGVGGGGGGGGGGGF